VLMLRIRTVKFGTRVAVRYLHALAMQHGESRLLQASAMVVTRKVEMPAPPAASDPSRPSSSRTSIVLTMMTGAYVAVFIGEGGRAGETREERGGERERKRISQQKGDASAFRCVTRHI
jgi:hypothetical protein